MMERTDFLHCSKEDRASRAARRREHILETSRRLFIENGFHGTGVAQIAGASGVKVGQIYRDFASKEDIIVAIARRDFSQFLDEAALNEAIFTGNRAAVHEWILTFTSYDEDVDGYRLMPEIMAESARNPRIAKLQEEMRDRVRAALIAALTAYAPGERRAEARCDLADLIATLGSGLCQWVIMAEQGGRGHRTLCAQLRSIVERELDALERCETCDTPLSSRRVFQVTVPTCGCGMIPDRELHG